MNDVQDEIIWLENDAKGSEEMKDASVYSRVGSCVFYRILCIGK